jgi:hypothetical protein
VRFDLVPHYPVAAGSYTVRVPFLGGNNTLPRSPPLKIDVKP